jgi:hypothetical protein
MVNGSAEGLAKVPYPPGTCGANNDPPHSTPSRKYKAQAARSQSAGLFDCPLGAHGTRPKATPLDNGGEKT